jgi:hypothetical protein
LQTQTPQYQRSAGERLQAMQGGFASSGQGHGGGLIGQIDGEALE